MVHKVFFLTVLKYLEFSKIVFCLLNFTKSPPPPPTILENHICIVDYTCRCQVPDVLLLLLFFGVLISKQLYIDWNTLFYYTWLFCHFFILQLGSILKILFVNMLFINFISK